MFKNFSFFWINVTRIVLIVATIYGAIKTADIAWMMGDLGVGMMAWLNIIAIWILHKPAINALKDYEQQKNNWVQAKWQFINLTLKSYHKLHFGCMIIRNA